MNQKKQLSITDIIRELNIGTATTKFILKRFNKWLPFDRIGGLHSYSRQTIPILIKIKECLDSGMLPSEIEQELENPSQTNFMKTNPMGTNPMEDNPMEDNPMEDIEKHFLEQPNEDIRLSRDGLSLIKSIFNDIKGHQDRIAIAHEKRAEAEQRKAVSIEKRAEAEEKKAIAMNNIANALQEMNQHRIHDGETREIALQSVQALAVDETDSEIDNLLEEVEQDEADVFDIPAPPFDKLETSDIEMDDLSALVDVDGGEDLGPATDKNKIPVSDIELESFDMDDLSLLLEDSIPKPDEFTDLDDLSALIDSVSVQDNSITDSDTDANKDDETDASPSVETPEELDDLSLLIDPQLEEALVPEELDDLSLLIDSSSQASNENSTDEEVLNDEAPMDDLSALIDGKKENIDLNTTRENALEEPMDDLVALIDEAPSLKPDITPQENIGEYKAAVMKIILGLKSEGYSAEETTKRLNKDEIQTLSGKPGWGEKSILQIYKFIDSAK